MPTGLKWVPDVVPLTSPVAARSVRWRVISESFDVVTWTRGGAVLIWTPAEVNLYLHTSSNL